MRGIQATSRVEFQASLGVFGKGVEFDSISRELKLQPSHSHRAGDPGLTRRPYPQDLWLLESPLPASEAFDAHLGWLRDALAPHYQFLRTLREKYEVRSYCGISSEGVRCQFRVSPDALRIFVDLGIAMNLTVIFVGGPECGASSDTAGTGRAQSPGSTVSLEFVGEASDVGEVSRELGPVAAHAREAGASGEWETRQGRGCWSVAAPASREEGPDAQLVWLAAELFPYASFLKSVVSRVEPVVRWSLRTESDIIDQSLCPEGLSLLTSFGIPLELDASLLTIK